MNDTPQGDGNPKTLSKIVTKFYYNIIRMNDTPQGDGNSLGIYPLNICQGTYLTNKNE